MGERLNSPTVEASKQIPSWPCCEGQGRKITLGSFPMNCPAKQSVICCLHEDFSLDSVCYPFLLYFTGTDGIFLCNLFSSAPSPSFSLLAALIVDFYLQSHRGHLWCQQQCSCWENKTNKQKNKSRKAPAGPLACRRSCEDRLPVNSASWKSVLQWQGLLLMILHVTSFPVHPNSLLDHPFCSTEWILALRHGWWGRRSVGKTWQCCFPETVSLCVTLLLLLSPLSWLLLYRCH